MTDTLPGSERGADLSLNPAQVRGWTLKAGFTEAGDVFMRLLGCVSSRSARLLWSASVVPL